MDGLRDAWMDLVLGAACVGCHAPGRSLCSDCCSLLPPVAAPARPTPCPEGLAACFAAGEYADLLRAMVVAHKEHAVFSLAVPLGRTLALSVQAASRGAGSVPVVLVPVPSRPSVVRTRGHDPMLRIARAAARELRREGRVAAAHRLLRSSGPVRDQAGLGAVDRGRNLTGTMHLDPGTRAVLAGWGRPVCLVVCDDVLTTGATAREAQRALEEAGVQVRAVATVAATRRRSPPASPARPG